MRAVRAILRWIGANLAPLLLVPLAAGLMWVSVWRIWLPPLHGGAVSRTVTTVDALDASHKVTRVVKTSRAAGPTRRSEALAMLLILLGAGAAIVAVFHDRIDAIELGKDGIKLELTPAEQQGAATLAARLARRGAPGSAYRQAFTRYLRAVGARTPRERALAGTPAGATAPALGLTAAEATSLADRIADELA